MTIVQQTLYRPGGSTPWANAKVTVSLVGPGFVAGGQVAGHKFALTDDAGLVSFDLTPTDTMTPQGCYYLWTGPDEQQYSIAVPSTGGPYNVASLLVGTPSMPVLGGSVSSVNGQTGAVDLSRVYAPGGSAGNINRSTAQGVALVQALIFGS